MSLPVDRSNADRLEHPTLVPITWIKAEYSETLGLSLGLDPFYGLGLKI